MGTPGLLVDDPADFLGSQRSAVESNVKAALDEWAKHIVGIDRLVIRIVVKGTHNGRFGGRGTRNVEIGTYEGKPICEDCAPHKLRTGNAIDVVDGEIEISPDSTYFRDEIFLDDDPSSRTAQIPANKLDGISVFTHEIGHILGINGHLNRKSNPPGEVLGGYSPYDKYVRIRGKSVVFVGPETEKSFGQSLPLMINDTEEHRGGNLYHYGNPGDGDPRLSLGLMTGSPLRWCHRYYVCELERAILRDTDLTLVPTR